MESFKPRFKIRRHASGTWFVFDRERRAWRGRADSLKGALAIVDRRVATEWEAAVRVTA